MTEYLNVRIDFTRPEIAAAYDEMPLWSAMFGQMLLRHVPMKAGMKALDVGCGTGFPLLELAQRSGPKSFVYGIDPWEEGLKRAELKRNTWNVKNVELKLGDAAKMPFPDGAFDLIVSNLGINNFEKPLIVFQECNRVLRAGGILALTTNLAGHMKEFYEVYRETLEELDRKAAIDTLQKHIDHRATVERVQKMLSETGFELTKVHREEFTMRFANGSALFRHSFIQLGFLDGWKEVVDPSEQSEVFERLENKLNEIAEQQNGLSLTIPMAYIEARKP